jgi:hypothetical protein
MGTSPSRPNPQLQQAQEMFKGLSKGRQVTLIAGVVGLIISFFPWYKVSVDYAGFSSSSSISAWHGWGFLAALLFIVAGAWILLPMLGVQVRGILASLPPTVTEARLVMGIGAVALLCTILFMLTEGPSGSSVGVSYGPSYGAYLGLIVSLAIIVGGYLTQQEPAA